MTTSNDPRVARYLQIHVMQMKRRVDAGQMVRWWDPLFQDIFKHYQSIQMNVKKIPKGIAVYEVGKTRIAIGIIHAHAQAVSKFVQRGRNEARMCHKLKRK